MICAKEFIAARCTKSLYTHNYEANLRVWAHIYIGLTVRSIEFNKFIKLVGSYSLARGRAVYTAPDRGIPYWKWILYVNFCTGFTYWCVRSHQSSVFCTIQNLYWKQMQSRIRVMRLWAIRLWAVWLWVEVCMLQCHGALYTTSLVSFTNR